MITKNIFKDDPPIECILCFLFYPFLVAQNLNAPHEMGYAPFFILWTYYFYRTNRFLPFLCLLFLSLSIKEHLSAAAVGFGFYAWLHKKDFRWVITPVALGLFWGIFSLGLMSHFQKVYQPQSDPSWFATNFKLQYLSCQGSTFSCLIDGFFSFFSDLRGVLPAAMLLLLPLGILPPLLSSIALLALPEVLLDLLAKRSVLFSPIWHYNVASSCFLLIGSMEGIKKIAGWGGKHFKLTPDQARRVIAVLMLATVLIHSYTWLDFTRFKKDSAYVTTVREAIATVPATAFFTVPRNIAPLISRREQMSLLNEGNPGDFVLIDHSEYSEPLREPLKAHYKQIYRKNDIAVYQKIP
jgi:uncharacterized membrane protein